MVLGPAERRVVKCSLKPLGGGSAPLTGDRVQGMGHWVGVEGGIDVVVVACPQERDVLVVEDKGETRALSSSESKQGRSRVNQPRNREFAVAITEFVIDSGAQQTLCGRLFARVGFWPSKA